MVLLSNFVEMCYFVRFGSFLVAAFFLLLSIIVYVRDPKKHNFHTHSKHPTRAIDLYMTHQKTRREHFFWLLMTCGIVALLIGAFLPSDYISGHVMRHTKGVSIRELSEPDAEYADYNSKVLYPIVLFAISGLLYLAGAVFINSHFSHGLYVACKFFFFVAVFALIFLILAYPDACSYPASVFVE